MGIVGGTVVAMLLSGGVAAPVVASTVLQDPPPVERGRAVGDGTTESTEILYARRHALVVGIDDYRDPGFPNLTYAEADARAVARLLIDQLGFAPDDVRLILGQDATKDALESALMDWACDPKRVGEHDLLVIFFAGHGVTRDLRRRGKRGYLVPVDGVTDRRGGYLWSSQLGMKDLEDISEAIPAKHVLVILDCCFGGLAINRGAAPVAAGLTSRARQVLTAGSAEQTVLDAGGGGHSIFTASVLEAIRGSADLDGDRVVTFGELFNFVGRNVENRTGRRQTPLQATLPDHEGGCIALFAPGVTPGATSVADRLKSLERTTEEQLHELKQLSDALVVIELLESEETLWPRRRHRVADFREWLGRARDVYSRRPRHENFLRRVRQEAYMRQILAGFVEEGEGSEPVWEKADPVLRWKFQTLQNLLSGLDELGTHIEDVSARLDFALTIEQRSIADFQTQWDEVIAAVASDPRYGGLRMSPQIGLVPLGVDPVSGLQEFWHVDSGDRPLRDAATGRLVFTEATGLVLVLIPGGSFHMGAAPEARAGAGEGVNVDRYATPLEAPVHLVSLDPYFISKCEMSQGQWLSVMRDNPSEYGPGQEHGGHLHTLLHPVENVSHEMCRVALGRLELDLPTEAQWEHAARAGTSTPWWTGAEMATLPGSVNLVDQSAVRAGLQWMHSRVFPQLDDGFVYHAPVDSFEPNPFGLHNVHGNVWEWCKDRYGAYDLPTRPGDGERMETSSVQRMIRSGSFRFDPGNARSSMRVDVNPGARDNGLGVRPARAVQG